MEPFQIKLEPLSPEKFDNLGNYNNYLKVDDVNEKILANLKSDTSVIRSFNIIKEEYDIPDDNHMVDEDFNNSDLENQENNSVNSESCRIQWPSKRNGQINSKQPNISFFDIFNIASNNNKLNDKVVDANTINNKENISFRKRSTPKFRHFCLHCNEERDVLRLYSKNACMKCEKLMILQCLKCNKQCNSPTSMRCHLQICNGHEKHFKCEQCHYRTSSITRLNQHKVRNHVEGKEVECSKCNKIFKNHCSFRVHERTYCGKTRDFACTFYSYKTHYKSYLKIHIKAHQNERYFQKTVENNKASADLHHLDDKHRQRLHLSTSTIQFFYQRYCLKCHKTFENSLVNSNDCKICQTQLSMKCTECNSLHKNLLDITNHLRYSKCIFKSKLQCYTCDFSTLYTNSLKRHIKLKHVKIAPENFYKCSKCPRLFKMKTGLTRHVKYSCISDKSYLLCDHCPFRTKSKNGLSNHIMSHMASENSVQFCSNKSTNRKSRGKLLLGFCSKCNASRKVGKRSSVCLKCKLPLVFPQRISVETSIQQALNLHEKKEHDYFECENCGKTFARLSNLDCHMKVCKSRFASGK